MATTADGTPKGGEGDDPSLGLIERSGFDSPTEMPKPG